MGQCGCYENWNAIKDQKMKYGIKKLAANIIWSNTLILTGWDIVFNGHIF